MSDDKVRMPSSGGGLVSYFEDYKNGIQIPPTAVLIAIGIVIVVGIYLHLSF